MNIIYGVVLSALIALVSTYFGKAYPVIGAPVIAIFIGMLLMPLIKKYDFFDKGLKFSSKKILQLAVILLGFHLSLGVIVESGLQSLPIIISTISIALLSAYYISKILNIDVNTATLIGVGSSICGGSAIAATAPVIEAKDDEIAKSMSVIFIFNVLAALIFPSIGQMLSMSDFGFGFFAGTAINDTSSVSAAASIWDGLYHANTLEIAMIVKLTRTLAIIPIVIFLSVYRHKKQFKNKMEHNALNGDSSDSSQYLIKNTAENTDDNLSKTSSKMSVLKLIPKFLILFLLASLIATVVDLPKSFIVNAKVMSKFFIAMAMGAIGLKTDIVHLIKTGGHAILLGFICWVCIILTSIGMQFLLGYI